MNLTFVEMQNFTEMISEYFGGDEHYRGLQAFLLLDPEQGRVIPGCGGIRKIRWPDPRRGKGKRGGLRILYIHIPQIHVIIFLDVYDKDEAEDLTAEQKRQLAVIAERVRKDYLPEENP
jgi:hypothetical protein